MPRKPARKSAKPAKRAKPVKRAPVKRATPAKSAAPGTRSSTNPFGLSKRDLKILREELEASSDPSSGNDIYEAATRPGAPPYEQFLLWLALEPGTRVGLGWLRSLEPLWTPEQACGALANLALEPHEYEDGAYEGAPSRLVDALLRIEAVDPQAVRAALARPGLPSFVPRLAGFMAWTRGEPIGGEDAAAMVTMFARTHVRGRRIATPDAYRGAVPFTCRSLGEALVGAEGWRQALHTADRFVGAHHLAHVRELFESGPWIELASALVPFDRRPTAADEQAFVDLLQQRDDSDDELFTLAATLRASAPSSVFAELAELVVAHRLLARHAPIDELATRLRFVTPLPFAVETSRRVLAALGADERRTLMRADRERPDSAGRSVVGLADDFDPAALAAYLELPRLDGPIVGVVGDRALAALEARLAEEQHPTMQLRLGMALFAAISTAVDAGSALTPSQLAYVARYPASHPRYAGVIAALPAAARDEVFRRAATENPKGRELALVAASHPPSDAVLRDVLAILVEREPEIDWSWTVPTLADYLPGGEPPAVEEDPVRELRAASATIGGARTRIYVFELRDEPAAPDELTRLGRAPQPGERHRHLLSIELAQVPELAARYPDATVLELHVPRIQDLGKPATRYQDTKLIARSRPRADDPGASGRLVLHGVSVPSRLFDEAARQRDEALSRLAHLLAQHPGYVMGDAITIQGDADGPGEFVMQLDDRFGIDLGDTGRLYVFTEGAAWDCA